MLPRRVPCIRHSPVRVLVVALRFHFSGRTRREYRCPSERPGTAQARARPGPFTFGPCRVSPRAPLTAQARAHRPVSCRASPLSPACLSGSGHPRPTKGEPATARRGRAGGGLAGGGAAECDGGGEARGEEVRRSAELLVDRGRRLGARRRGERRSRVSRLGLREEARGGVEEAAAGGAEPRRPRRGDAETRRRGAETRRRRPTSWSRGGCGRRGGGVGAGRRRGGRR